MSDYHSSDPPTTPGRTWTSLSTYRRFDQSSSEDASSDIYTRRTLASPAQTDFYDTSSMADEAEVEAALSSVGTNLSSNWDSYVLDPFNFPPRILSMITERTEDPQSRPSSFRSSTLIPARPASAAANSATSTRYESLPPRSITPGNVSRISHDRSRTVSPERTRPPRSGRALDLIAFFEDKSASGAPSTQSRSFRSPVTTSSPSLQSSRRTQSESSSSTSYDTIPRSTTLPSLDYRSISPFKSAPTLSSLLSPARTETHSIYSTAVSSGKQLPRTPTSPRTPLASVRKIVAAWKERTPSLGKSSKASSVVSDSSHDSFLSITRRQLPAVDRSLPPIPAAEASKASIGTGNGGPTVAKSTNGSNGSNSQNDNGNGNGNVRKSNSSTSSSNKSPFDLAELGPFAQPNKEPIRVGQLWYLNVHTPPPFRWIRTQAVLYPHVLILSWIAPGGGRGVITLDLLNCNEVRSVPSPSHPSAQDDIGTIAAREQATGSGPESTLREFLCPFQLLYPDGVERLGAESARERVRWVGAVWEALNRSVTLPDPSVRSRSPAPSIGTIRSESSSDSQSRSGSRSTVYVPPLDTLPDIGGSSAASVSSRSSLVGVNTPLDEAGLYHRRRASDDASIDGAGMLYPVEGSKVIAPSRSSSLRRTSSLEDLNTEFKSAFSEPRSILYGKPVTVSSGPSAPGTVFVSPPPSAGKKSRTSSAKASSESSESAAFRTAPSRLSARTTPASSYYSFPPSQRAPSHGESPVVTPLRTLQSIPLDSPQIRASTLSLRGSQSASLLGDSHEGDLSDSNSLGSYRPSTPNSKRVTFPSDTSPKSPKPPSKTAATTLSRSPGIRRRIPRRSSSRKTSSSGSNANYVTAVEGSDKENDSTIDSHTQTFSTLRPGTPTASRGEDSQRTPTRYSQTATPTNLSDRPTFTRTSTYDSIGYDICPSSDLSDFTPLSMTDTYSVLYSQSEAERAESDVFLSIPERALSERALSDSDVFLSASEPATFATARTPSPTSTHFTTASRAPSSTQYETAASSGSTEFHTLSTSTSSEYVSLESVPSSNEYQTAEVCSEYETAEKCPSSPSTEFHTVEPCPCPPTPKTASISDIVYPELPPSPEISPESPSLARSLSRSSESTSLPETLPPMDLTPSPLATPEPESSHDTTPIPISTATEEDSSPIELSTPTPQSTPTPRLTPLPSLSPTISSIATLSIEMPSPSSPSSPSSIIPSMPSMTTPSISTDLITPSTVSSPEELPSSGEVPSLTPSSIYEEELSIVSTSRPPSRMSTIPSLPDESTPRLTPSLSIEPSTRLSIATESDTVPFTVSLSVSSESSIRASTLSRVSPMSPSLLTLSSRTVSTPSISSEPDTATGTFLLPSSVSTATRSLSLPQSSEELSMPSMPSASSPVSAAQVSLYEESTGTYDSSLLEPSPSVHSMPLQENPDISYDTSFLGPTVSAQSEPQGVRFPITPVPPSPPPSPPPPPAHLSPPKTPPSLSPPQITVQPSSPPPPSEHTVSSPTTASSDELPISLVDVPPPAPRSKSPSSLTPSMPLSDLPPPSPPSSPSFLSPPSEPSPSEPSPSPSSSESFYPTTLTPSLTRTPSSVSSISMRSSRISPDEESLYEFESTMTPTESSPWLPTPSSVFSVTESLVPLSDTPTELSTSISSSSTPVPPSSSSSEVVTVIPQSRTVTPQPSFSVSVSTPWSNVPSIRSQLDTIPSDVSETVEREPSEPADQVPPSSILTHDVNRLLQYLHDINDIRNGQHVDLHHHMDSIGNQLNDLATKIQDEMAARRGFTPPPTRLKDVSVGRSSVSSRTATPVPPRSPAQSVSSFLNVRPSALSSITTSSSSVSWLSSHHSEDWELMSSELLEDLPVFVQAPSHPSSPSGPSSPTVSSPSSESTLSDDYPDSSLSSSLTPPQHPPPPASPTPSVETVRPQSEQMDIPLVEQEPNILALIRNLQAELTGLRSHFEQTRHLIDEIHQETRNAADREPVQIVIPPRAEIIREERAVPDAEEQRMYSDMIRDVQATLREVKDILTRDVQTTTASGSTVTDGIDTQYLFDFPSAPQPPPASIPIHAPTPVPARSPPSLLNLLSQMSSRLPDMPPPAESIRLDPLPSIRIPVSRPRPRSASPSTIIRPSSAPVTGTGQRPAGVPPFVPPESSSGDEQPPGVTAPFPQARVLRDPGHRRPPIHVRPAQPGETRPGQPQPFHGPPPHEVPPRLPSAPPAVGTTTFRSTRPRATQQPQAQPAGQRTPRTFVGGPVPVPAPPPVPPPEYLEIMRLLRLDREARDATLEQQGEMINYMRRLNSWLERDVQDRHAEIQGVGERIDRLRNDLARFVGIAPAVPVGPTPYPPTFFPPRLFQGGPPVPQPPPPIGRGTPFRGPGFRPGPGADDDDGEGPPFIPPHPDTFADVPAGFVPYPGAPPPGFWPGGASVYSSRNVPAGFVPQQGRGGPSRINVVSPSPSGAPRRSRFGPVEDDDEPPFVPPESAEVSPARTDVTVRAPGPRPPPDPNAPPAVVFTQPTGQPTQQLSDVRPGGGPSGAAPGPSGDAAQSTQPPLFIIPPPATQGQQPGRFDGDERSPGPIIIQQAPSTPGGRRRSSSRRSRASNIIVRPPASEPSSDEDMRDHGRSRTPNIIIRPASQRSRSRPEASDIGRIPPTVIPVERSSDERDSPPLRDRESRRRTPSVRSSRRPSALHDDPRQRDPRDYSPADEGRPSRSRPYTPRDYSPEDEGRPRRSGSRGDYYPEEDRPPRRSRSRAPSIIHSDRRGSRRGSRTPLGPTVVRMGDEGSESDSGGDRPIVVVPRSGRSSRPRSRGSRYDDGGVTVIERPGRSRSRSPSRPIYLGDGSRGRSPGRASTRTPIILGDRPTSSRRSSRPHVVIPEQDYRSDEEPPTYIVPRSPRSPSGREGPIIVGGPSSRHSRSRPSSVILQQDEPYDDVDDRPSVVYAPPRSSRRSSRAPSIIHSRGPSRLSQRPQTVVVPQDDYDDESPEPVYVPRPSSARGSRPPSVIYENRPRSGSRRGSIIVQDPYESDRDRDREPTVVYAAPPRTASPTRSIISRSSRRGDPYVQDPYDERDRGRDPTVVYAPPPLRSESPARSMISRSSRRPSTRASRRPVDIVAPRDEYSPERERPPLVFPTRTPSPQPIGYADAPYEPSRAPSRARSSRPLSIRSGGSYRPDDAVSRRSHTPVDDDYIPPRSIVPLSPEDEDDGAAPVRSTRGSAYGDDGRRSRSRTPRQTYVGEPEPVTARDFAEPRGRLTRPPSAFGDEGDFPERHSIRGGEESPPPLTPRSFRDYGDPRDRAVVTPRRSRPPSMADAPIRHPPTVVQVSRPGSVHGSVHSGYSPPPHRPVYDEADVREPRFSRAPTVIPGDEGDEGLRPSSPEFLQTRTATPYGRTSLRGSPVEEELRGIPRSRSRTPVSRRSVVLVPSEEEEDVGGAGAPVGRFTGAPVERLANVGGVEPVVRRTPPVVTTPSPPMDMQNVGGVPPPLSYVSPGGVGAGPIPGPLETPLVDDHISLPPEGPERPDSTPAIPFEERMALVFNNSEDERRLRYQDAERMRDDSAVQAENRRDEEFHAHEAERQKVFEENEMRRNRAGGEVQQQILQAADERLADVGAGSAGSVVGSIGGAEFEPEDGVGVGAGEPGVDVLGDVGAPVEGEAAREAEAGKAESDRAQSIRETVHSVLDTHADALHHSAQQERQELYKLIEAEQQRNAEYANKIKSLEEEIVTLRDTHEAEKVEREQEQAAKMDQFSADLAQRDTDMKEQLASITKMLEEKKEECERLRVMNDERWARKEERWERKDAEGVELKEMLQRVLDEQNEVKEREAREKEEKAQQKGIDDVLEALRKQQEEQNAVLNALADGWKSDCERQQKEIIDTVKATAQEQVPFNVQGYLDQFSQALAEEVRMLLHEVGKLREEKRNIQHEIGFLLCARSKYGPGGEFDPDWRPSVPMYGGPPGGGFPPGGGGGGFPPGGFPPGFGPGPGGPGGFHPGPGSGFDGPPLSTAGGGDDGPPVGSAWRPVQPPQPPKLSKRQRKQKAAEEAAAAAQAQGLGQGQAHGFGHGLGQGAGGAGPSLPRESWATWRPDPQFAPTPSSHDADLVPPAQPSPPGLFGPRSLSPKGKRM